MNKTDLPTCLSPIQVRKDLHLEELRLQDVECNLVPISAISMDSADLIYDGFEWLSKKMQEHERIPLSARRARKKKAVKAELANALRYPHLIDHIGEYTMESWAKIDVTSQSKEEEEEEEKGDARICTIM